MRYEAGQGGGWLGVFSLPVIRHLFNHEGHPECRLGVSVNAINQTMAAQEDWDVLEGFYDGMDDKFTLDGIRGYLNLSLRGGVFSMAPLREKMDEHVHLDRLKCSVEVGVTSRKPFHYFGLRDDQAKTDAQWRDWVQGSSAIAFLMQTIETDLPDGSVADLRDGGHMHSVPWFPELNEGDTWDVIVHHPMDAHNTEVPPPSGCGRLVDELRWVAWVHFHNGHWEAMRRIRRVVYEHGVTVRIWAPSRPLGDMLDASKEAMDMRYDAGREAVRRGPVILRP